MDNKELTECFSAAGSAHGYKTVTARFAAFRDFKIRWSRTYKWAEFEVSDYINGAPGDIMCAIAETIFDKICGGEGGYPGQVIDWLNSEEFLRDKQPVYARRFPGFLGAVEGTYKNLDDSRRRLVDAGLLEDDPDLRIGWVTPGKGKAVGHASVLMKVVGISGLLDSEGVPDGLLDFCLYTQTAHVSMGFDPARRDRDTQYEELLSLFPDRDEYEMELCRRKLHFRGGRCPPCANTPCHRPAVTPASGR